MSPGSNRFRVAICSEDGKYYATGYLARLGLAENVELVVASDNEQKP